ncbi:MAG: hypothetical protein HRT45_01570 [Bdellovibrionales bacterium]|nr:hypothetical protein [Bdellovibrionales bacterium]
MKAYQTIAVACIATALVFASLPAAANKCPVELAKTSVTETGPYHLQPIHSYDDVLRALIAEPYDYNNLPIHKIVNFDFSTYEFHVGNRSRDILHERHVILPFNRPKPIHAMGLPVRGRMVFFGNSSQNYSGVFRGGTFSTLGRFSISQDNPFRFEQRTARQIRRNQPASPQVRSVTMGLVLFDPDVPNHEASPLVSLVLQNDLNGKLNAETGMADYFLEENVLNKPVFSPGLLLPPTGRIYHWGTLAGVFFGAVQSDFEDVEGADGQGVESATLGVDPLLRPPHGLANFGETDPADVNTPVWLDFRPSPDNPPIVKRDDFRHEVYESLQQGAYVYEIWAANTISMPSGEKNWEHVGNYIVDEAYLPSLGSDQGTIIPHADVTNRNYFTGKSIYDSIRVLHETTGQ